MRQQANRKSRTNALPGSAMAWASILLMGSLCLTGCLGQQSQGTDKAQQTTGETETVTLADRAGTTGTAGGDEQQGELETTSINGESNETSQGGSATATEDLPVEVTEDTKMGTGPMAGSWKCICIIEGGEEAYAAEVKMKSLPILVLDANGSGTLTSNGTPTPVTWSHSEAIPRIDKAGYKPGKDPKKDGDGTSGQAWVTKGDLLIWHADGASEKDYTLWIRVTSGDLTPMDTSDGTVDLPVIPEPDTEIPAPQETPQETNPGTPQEGTPTTTEQQTWTETPMTDETSATGTDGQSQLPV